MQGRLYRWLQDTWYGGGPGRWLLLPLSGVFWLLVAARRWLYKAGLLRQVRIAVPVIVVGNLTAGGTGKTPVTLWLAEALRTRGFRPGFVSRGYGGSKSASPMRVDSMSDPETVGDEPVLLARCSGLPVRRYGPETLGTALGPGFSLEEARFEDHVGEGRGVAGPMVATRAGCCQPLLSGRVRRGAGLVANVGVASVCSRADGWARNANGGGGRGGFAPKETPERCRRSTREGVASRDGGGAVGRRCP